MHASKSFLFPFKSSHFPHSDKPNSRKEKDKGGKENKESPVSVQNPNSDRVLERNIQTHPNNDPWNKKKKKMTTKTKTKKGQVFLERFVESEGREEVQPQQHGVSRTKSLTDEDLDELKGCLDLGFGFSYEEIPELCSTLPALELCYSMSQRFLEEQQQQQQHRSPEASAPTDALPTESSSSSSPIANWKISSPGDDPEEVKARLKFWAQAVACTVRLCS